MREQIASLQNQILEAPPEVVVAAAIFLFAVLVRLVFALPVGPRAVEEDDLEAEARRWIDDRIDDYVEVFADAYGDAGTAAAPDDLPLGFAATIESFIAEVLLRERDAEELDLDLGVAIREFVVLHRAEVYEDVTDRTRAYLAAAASRSVRPDPVPPELKASVPAMP